MVPNSILVSLKQQEGCPNWGGERMRGSENGTKKKIGRVGGAVLTGGLPKLGRRFVIAFTEQSKTGGGEFEGLRSDTEMAAFSACCHLLSLIACSVWEGLVTSCKGE